MITAIEKNPARKSSTASKRPPKQTNAARSRQNDVDSNPPVAPAPGCTSNGCAPPAFPKWSDLTAKYRADGPHTEQPSQDREPVAARPLSAEQMEATAEKMFKVLEGVGGLPSLRKSAPAPKPTGTPIVVGDEFLEQTVPAIMLAGLLRQALRMNVEPALVERYLENMAEECGVADDPLGRSLVEQLAMLRIVAANLHTQTLICTKSTEVAAINAAGCAVAAEIRRTATALKAFQTGSGSFRSKRDVNGVSLTD